MQSNILWPLLLLFFSFHYTEGAYFIGRWLYSGNLRSSEEATLVAEPVVTAVEPEKKRIILEESIDPIHHNFILYEAPVPSSITTKSKIAEYNDSSDPMDMISQDIDFSDRLYNTVNQKMIQLGDLIDRIALMKYGPSQFSESESEAEADEKSYDEHLDEDNVSDDEDYNEDKSSQSVLAEDDEDFFEVVLVKYGDFPIPFE